MNDDLLFIASKCLVCSSIHEKSNHSTLLYGIRVTINSRPVTKLEGKGGTKNGLKCLICSYIENIFKEVVITIERGVKNIIIHLPISTENV